MNKNFKQKIKDLFAKEGFYIALFLCLCIIVTVGTFSYKKYVSQNQVNNSQSSDNEVSYNSSDESDINEDQIQNAERAENDADSSTSKTDSKDKKENKSAAVSTTNNVNFVKPLDGEESRTYSYPTPVKVGENTFRTIKGVNLQAKIGTNVKASAEGVVDKVENSGVEDGMIVEIKHANGMKTIYGNLEPNVSVKQGDKVTANQVIGKVGETSKVFTKDDFGEFLNLQVVNANGEQVNPEKYFNFTSK